MQQKAQQIQAYSLLVFGIHKENMGSIVIYGKHQKNAQKPTKTS